MDGPENKSADVNGTDTDVVGEQSEKSVHEDHPSTMSVLLSFVRREIHTALLTPSYLGLCVTIFVAVFGIILVGGGFQAGYVSTVVDLLTPLQLLVPVAVVALGYSAVLSDNQSGELDVFETYPISAGQYVLGVFLGRALGTLVAIGAPLVVLFFPLAVTDAPRLPMYASHTGADSPFLYLRLVVLTLLFALVVLAIVIALSALVSTARTAILAASVLLVLLLFGLDLALSFGFSMGVIGESNLVSSLAISPLSAYRGLVLETAIVVTEGTGPDAASPIASAFGLFVWGTAALTLATFTLRR